MTQLCHLLASVAGHVAGMLPMLESAVALHLPRTLQEPWSGQIQHAHVLAAPLLDHRMLLHQCVTILCTLCTWQTAHCVQCVDPLATLLPRR